MLLSKLAKLVEATPRCLIRQVAVKVPAGGLPPPSGFESASESKPFVESVEPDGAALDFYQRHQFGDGKYLSTDKQTEYANNAAV